MLEQLVGEGTELGSEGEKVVVIFHLGVWYTEKWLSGDKLKENATETPNIKGIINGSGKNQLGGSKTEWSDGPFWRTSKEIG